MTSPKTPQQLADAIETVVASYLDEVRRTVQHAVERSLSRAAATARLTKSRVDRSPQQRSIKTRRSAGALDELCDKLHHACAPDRANHRLCSRMSSVARSVICSARWPTCATPTRVGMHSSTRLHRTRSAASSEHAESLCTSLQKTQTTGSQVSRCGTWTVTYCSLATPYEWAGLL